MSSSLFADGENDPPRTTRQRTGQGPIERQAVARARLEIASMPASDVVQLALWPDNIASWARASSVSGSVVYNMLGRVKPYRRVRELLAHRLDVPAFVLDHLIDAARPLPVALRPPDPDRPPPEPRPAPATDEPVSLTLLLPGVRDGSNPLERRALFRVEREVAALPASVIVQLALYPETLAAWARREELPASMLYATLAGVQANLRMRHALARRLGVSPRDVEWLIDATRAEPLATRPPTPADRAATEPTAPPPPSEPSSSGPAPSGRTGEDRDAADPRQLDLGL